MFCTPVSGSRVMTLVAVSVGALSKPGVETGIGSRSRPLPSPCSASPSITTSWQAASLTSARRDRIGDGVVPLGLDVLDLRAHADAVDLRVGGDRADHDRHVVFAPAPVDDVGEQERLALVLVDAADELPAHQRMQFGILVDRPVDGAQQAALLQRLQMLVQIAIASRRLRHGVFPADPSGQHTG